MLISDNSSNTSFAKNTLDGIIAGSTLLDTDIAWYRFLVDHRQEIRDYSSVVTVDESIMARYQYRIRDYLDERQLHKTTLEIAFRVANRFVNDTDFDLKVTTLYIPDIRHITALRNKYVTWKNKYLKL